MKKPIKILGEIFSYKIKRECSEYATNDYYTQFIHKSNNDLNFDVDFDIEDLNLTKDFVRKTLEKKVHELGEYSNKRLIRKQEIERGEII